MTLPAGIGDDEPYNPYAAAETGVPRHNKRGGITEELMSSTPQQPEIRISSTADYREGYANSVQIRVSVWDFLLLFGTMSQSSQSLVQIQNFQGVYLSPQQAKALWNVLGQNVGQYESTFGEIKLDPRAPTNSIAIQ